MYEEVTISSTHPDCVEECLWCTNRVEAGTIAPQREGGSREAVLSENLCHPRHHKRGDRVSGGVERSETVLEGTACRRITGRGGRENGIFCKFAGWQ